jgi:antitoxin component YwqK of YwqJK toxin-antitoxin module
VIYKDNDLKYSVNKDVYYFKNTYKLFSGKVIDTHEEKMHERNFLDGKFHGKSLYYYSSGNLSLQENYQFGELHGKWIRFYENGNKDLQMLYNNGNLEIYKFGAWDKWNEDNILEEQRIYYNEHNFLNVVLKKDSIASTKEKHCLFCDGFLLPLQGFIYLDMVSSYFYCENCKYVYAQDKYPELF